MSHDVSGYDCIGHSRIPAMELIRLKFQNVIRIAAGLRPLLRFQQGSYQDLKRHTTNNSWTT